MTAPFGEKETLDFSVGGMPAHAAVLSAVAVTDTDCPAVSLPLVGLAIVTY